MKFYEIYVPGKNGFSTFVKTDLEVHDEDTILNRAIAAQVIEVDDAKDILYHNNGYVALRNESASDEWAII